MAIFSTASRKTARRIASNGASFSDSQQGIRSSAIHASTQEVVPLVVNGSANSPTFGFLSTTLHGTVGYLSSGWPVAYLIATVIFGLGLLIGSVVQVSEPAQIAKQSSVPSRVAPELTTEPVGRITGMVDCQFAQGSGGRGQEAEISNLR